MLSIILVNWNGWADTIACVQSILNAEPVAARVIIVDNMSTNCSLEAFERWSAGDLELVRSRHSIEKLAVDGAMQVRQVKFVRYIEEQHAFEGSNGSKCAAPDRAAGIYVVSSGRNGGFGFGCNVGMRLADQLGSDGYWLLNNDCVVSREALSKVSQAISMRPDTAFGTIVRYYSHPEKIQAVGGGHLSPITFKNTMQLSLPIKAPLNYIYGASLAFSRQVRAKVGDFDENIFMYYEEMDFCLRVAKAGFRFDAVEANVFHRHGGSQGGVSATAWKYVLVNKCYVLHKHFGWGLWVAPYSAALLVRCLNPFGPKNAKAGARLALKVLLSKGPR